MKDILYYTVLGVLMAAALICYILVARSAQTSPAVRYMQGY